MKRLTLMLLAAMLAFGAASADELSGRVIVTGHVAAAHEVYVTAPYSGTLLPFDLAMGDRVSAGDTLMELMVTRVVAPEDGTLYAMFLQPGDSAEAVMAKYGCLGAMEGTRSYRVEASTSGAYDKKRNHLIHVGEEVEMRVSSSGSTREGTGRVIAVSGSQYVLEVLTGDYDIGDTVQIYRGSKFSSQDKIGSGKVIRRDPVLLTGVGVAASVAGKANTHVRAGEELLTLMGPDADRGASPLVTAPADSVVAQVAVAPGQQVWKGQALAVLYLTDALEIVAEVDELDLRDLKIGDQVPVTLDMRPQQVLTATVTELSALGVTRQNAAYFTVRLALDRTDLPIGATASVYLAR